jgi:KaiC/GvpD/RAD55 family RecA-like ATPase
MELPPLGVDEKNPILKKRNMGTGIADLDILLEGGYMNPGLVMIRGPTGMEKMALAFHFAKAGLLKGDKVYYINADFGPEDVLNKASSAGIDLKGGKDMKFIDCYSMTIGTPKENPNAVLIPSLTALNDLSLAINEAIRDSAGKRMRVIFHSLSSFMLYNSQDSLIKFIQVVNGRLKNADATVLMLVEDGMHDKQLLSSIEHFMDERFIIHDKGGSIELEIPEVPMPVPIRIGPGGITIL